MVRCAVCEKLMEDRGAETQWCSKACFNRGKIQVVPDPATTQQVVVKDD